MSDKQIRLDQMGGPSGDNPEDDIIFIREGGQTDYSQPRGEPFDAVSIHAQKARANKFMDVDLQVVPIASQEDRSLIVYDFSQVMYNANLDGSGNLVDPRAFVVESGWWWFVDRMAIFGSGFTAGFVKIYDGSVLDDATCFNIQPGNAVKGGISTVSASAIMSPGTPIGVVASGAGVSGTLSIGLWYRRCKWVWTPQSFQQEDTLTAEKEHRGVEVGN